jgi:hypothetical protein
MKNKAPNKMSNFSSRKPSYKLLPPDQNIIRFRIGAFVLLPLLWNVVVILPNFFLTLWFDFAQFFFNFVILPYSQVKVKTKKQWGPKPQLHFKAGATTPKKL